MTRLLQSLTPADYHFLVGLTEGTLLPLGDRSLGDLLATLEREDTPAAREALAARLEREIRYLGSADLAYLARFLAGGEPGVPLREVVRDVARALKVSTAHLETDRETLEQLVQDYVSQEFSRQTPEAQQQMLESLGVEREKAAAFLLRSAGAIAVPALVQAFGTLVVDGIIRNVIFGAIGRVIGRQLSNRLFGLVASRFPWWVRWIGPATWTVSLGWIAVDLQGPALRKTIPIVLYLGLCSLRLRQEGG